MPPKGSNKATSHPGLGFRYGHFLLHSVGVSNEKDGDDDDSVDDERDASAAFLDRATNSSSPSNTAPHFVKKDLLVLVSLLWLILLLLPMLPLLPSSLFHNRSMFGKASKDRLFQRVQSTSPSASKVRINRARSEWLDPIPIGLPSTSVTTRPCSLLLLLLPEVFDATNDSTRCFAMEDPTGPFPITMYDDTDEEDDDTAEARAPEEDIVLDIDEPIRISPVRGRRIRLRKYGTAMVGLKHCDDDNNTALVVAFILGEAIFLVFRCRSLLW